MNPAKTAEPTEMPFWGLTHVGPRNSMLEGVKIGRIHWHTRGMTSRRGSLLPQYCGHLLIRDGRHLDYLFLRLFCN